MSKNFVSVSGVSDRRQLAGIASICREERFSFPLVLGYQVSSKSINEGTQNSRQPRFLDLGVLDKETRDYGLISAVHYYTRDSETIMRDLERIIDVGVKPSLLQFNTLPFQSDLLRRISELGFNIIFKAAVSDKQLGDGGYAVWKGDEAQDVISGDVGLLVNQLLERREFISYAMFDPSHGTNLGLNLDEDSLAIRFGKEIVRRKDLDNLGLVYAGGINPDNVRDVKGVLNSFLCGRVSVDIESGVRKDDGLDLDLVRSYLIECKD